MKGRLTLNKFVGAVSANAARRYGIDHKKRSIEGGKDADLVLVDPKDRMVVRGEALLSKGLPLLFQKSLYLMLWQKWIRKNAMVAGYVLSLHIVASTTELCV